MIHKIHYISNGDTAEDQITSIHAALDAGQTWIQYRFKNATPEILWKTAELVKIRCDAYKATLIINDHVNLAQAIQADGVHLGLTDLSTKDAKIALPNQIIGGTANTVEDVLLHYRNGCDYVGLGPYRFTTTKQKLSPILGLKGYQTIFNALQAKKVMIPIIAIGGIQLEDVVLLLKTGIHGIAISSLLENSLNKHALLKQLNAIH